ncbi:MAG: hypothetical protein ACLS8R_03855 [Anaeromassilibacillus sp.]
MDELVDKKAELARLTKELESAQKQYATTQQKLSNEKFLSKAPENVVGRSPECSEIKRAHRVDSVQH